MTTETKTHQKPTEAQAPPVASPPTPAQQRLRSQLVAASVTLVASAVATGGARGKKVHLVASAEAWELVLRLRAALAALESAES